MTLRLLHLEDNADFARVFAAYIDRDVSVITVGSIAELEEIVKRRGTHDLDGAIVDLSLPDSDASDTLPTASILLGDVPIFVLSGHLGDVSSGDLAGVRKAAKTEVLKVRVWLDELRHARDSDTPMPRGSPYRDGDPRLESARARLLARGALEDIPTPREGVPVPDFDDVTTSSVRKAPSATKASPLAELEKRIGRWLLGVIASGILGAVAFGISGYAQFEADQARSRQIESNSAASRARIRSDLEELEDDLEESRGALQQIRVNVAAIKVGREQDRETLRRIEDTLDTLERRRRR